MRVNSETGNGGSFFSKKNIIIMGALVVLVACGWYGYTRYKKSSGASVRERILQDRDVKPRKDTDPKKTFYDNLDKLNLTPEQKAKMNATRNLPVDKEGWTQRKKTLAETLTDEQMKQMKQQYGGGDTRWQKSVRNLNEEDQRAIQRQIEGLKSAGRKDGKK